MNNNQTASDAQASLHQWCLHATNSGFLSLRHNIIGSYYPGY